MGSMLAGQGVVAVALSGIQLGASWSQVSKIKIYGSDAEIKVNGLGQSDLAEAQKTAIAFFASSTVFTVITLLVFGWLVRTEVYNEIESRRVEVILRAKGNDSQRLLDGNEANEIGEDEVETETFDSNSDSNDPELLPHFVTSRISISSKNHWNRMLKIQKKVWISSFTICLLFGVTLSVFPALTSRIQSTSTISIPILPTTISTSSTTSEPQSHPQQPFSYLSSPLFFTSLHFFLFNLSDLIGRSLPSINPSLFLIKSFKFLLSSSILRILFIPLLRSCNLRSSSSTSTSESTSFLATDLSFFILLILLGLSNGLISTSTFVIGPGIRNSKLKDDERPLAASIISLWLTVGLAMGSVGSFWIAR